MSHKTVDTKHNIKRLSVLKKVCEERGYGFKSLDNQKVDLGFGNSHVAVAKVKLPDWNKWIAIDKNGNLAYDHWGNWHTAMSTLGGLVQQYNEEAIIEDAWATGELQDYYVEECKEEGEGWKQVVLEY